MWVRSRIFLVLVWNLMITPFKFYGLNWAVPPSFMIILLLILLHLQHSQVLPVHWFWKTSLFWFWFISCIDFFSFSFFSYFLAVLHCCNCCTRIFFWSLDFPWFKMLAPARIRLLIPYPLFWLLYYSHCIILLYFEFYINKEACLHFKKKKKFIVILLSDI